MGKQTKDDFSNFKITEQEIKKLVDLFNQGVLRVDEISKKMSWQGKKANDFLQYAIMMAYLDFEDNDIFNEDASLIFRENKILEFINDLPVEINDSAFDSIWREEAYSELLKLFEEISMKSKKAKFALNDIETYIGMSICCIRHKPEKLCQEVIDIIGEIVEKNYKTKKEFANAEINELMRLTLEQLKAQKGKEDIEANDLITDFELDKLFADIENSRRASVRECYIRGVQYHEDNEFDKAIESYTRAAKRGHRESLFGLGLLYSDIEYDEMNLKKAVDFYTKAAEHGHTESKYKLGCILSDNDFEGKDYELACKYFLEAAEEGDAHALDYIEDFAMSYFGDNTIYDVKIDIEKAVALCKKIADMGSTLAQLILAECYEEGRGVLQNYKTADKYYISAADKGDCDSAVHSWCAIFSR